MFFHFQSNKLYYMYSYSTDLLWSLWIDLTKIVVVARTWFGTKVVDAFPIAGRAYDSIQPKDDKLVLIRKKVNEQLTD